jgi:site-specific recombinase
MFKLLQRKKQMALSSPKEKGVVLSLNSGNRGLELLVEIVKKIRPKHFAETEEAELRFKALLFQLQEDKSLLFALRKTLLTLFLNTNLNNALTESGVVSSRGFVQELIGKLKHKLLPALQVPGDFLYIISHVFYQKKDYVWVQGIDKSLWRTFFELLGIQVNLTDISLTRQLNQALQILSHRVTVLGMEKDITARFDNLNSAIHPFLEQNRLVGIYLERFTSSTQEEKHLLLQNIEENLYNCRQNNKWVSDQRVQYGTSLAQTFIMVRIEQQIERMLIILDALDANDEFNTDRFIEYFITIVKNENRKNSVREFLSENLAMLAYQIAEHKGKRGEAYISDTSADYKKLFYSAMNGGLIVSFVAMVKNLLSLLPLPIFWQGIAYGSNYAAGFVLMDQTGGTLATKQPAYTASAVAGSLDTQKWGGRPDLKNLAITVAKVSRSQIASFAGNLVVVFPLTYALAWLFHYSFGVKLMEGVKAERLLADQHPFSSPALLFACFTGVFLFLSGLIAGYIENHVVYGRIADRLISHPVFTNTMSAKRLNRLVKLVDKSSGALAGSIVLGFLLGCAGPLGKFLGIPFDIRHITISAGNTAIGFYGLDHAVPLKYLLTVVCGVLMIGFLNFFVSFSLAFYVAIRSRGIQLKDYKEFIGILGRYFRKYPRDFLLPPRGGRTVENL